MRVLYITQGFPAESMVGGQISSYFRIVQLVRAGHAVTALCLVPRGDAQTDPGKLSEICSVVPVRDVPRTTTLRLALGFFDRLPWPIRRYSSRAAARAAAELARSLSPDLVVFNSLHSAPLLPAVRSVARVPCLLFSPNVQSTIMSLFAAHQRGPLAKLYAWDQAQKMREYESARAGRFDAVCVYSREDSDGLSELAPSAAIEITPMALDLDAMGTPAAPDFDILLTGSFEWRPNVDSLEWFLREIHPRIIERRPGTMTRVVGPRSEVYREQLSSPGVMFEGRVDDIAPYFRTARLLVVPLRIGSGIRVKIVQAFGARLPVVSTSKGCEGLEAKDGIHVAVADDPETFAERVTHLLDHADARAALARAGRALAERSHSALSQNLPFVAVCERLASGQPPATRSSSLAESASQE